jgi:hypothetical protein
MGLFVMRWVSHKGLHYTKKFPIRLDCTVMKSSSGALQYWYYECNIVVEGKY